MKRTLALAMLAVAACSARSSDMAAVKSIRSAAVEWALVNREARQERLPGEIGGAAIILHLLTGFSTALMALGAFIVLTASIWILPFKWIERIYGLLGLFMIIFPSGPYQHSPALE